MKPVVILPNNPNPCLGDICIPVARIRAAMEIFSPYNPEFEPDKDFVFDHDVLVGAWNIIHDAVEEIQFIVNHNERQEYAEVRVRREAEAALKERIKRIRSGEVGDASILADDEKEGAQ